MSTIPASKILTNADWSGRTFAQEAKWLVIDGIGTCRNICAIVGSAAELVAGTASKVASLVSGAVIPISLIGGGALVLATTPHHIQSAIKECKGAMEDDEIAMKTMDPEKIKLADEGIALAALGFTNSSLYGFMGAGMVQCGAVTLMSPGAASVFGGHALVSAGAASASSGVLGGIYLVRGSVLVAKSAYGLHYLRQFEKGFKNSLQLSDEKSLAHTVEDAVDEIRKIGELKNALGRRIGDKVPPLPGRSAPIHEKIAYLEAVDKGIQERKLQEILGLVIGIAMILGGIASLVAMGLCAPATIAIIVLVSGVFFVTMETVFSTYDSSYLFGKLRDNLYTPSDEILAIQKAAIKEASFSRRFSGNIQEASA